MGYYIETGTNHGKADVLVEKHGAVKIPCPKSYGDIPDNLGLVCVVDNIYFEAAAYCYSEREFVEFNNASDPRRRQWLLMDKILAKQLSGFV